MKKVIVSEYTALGHPDKIADQISDSLLDAFLTLDPNAKTGIEVLVKDNVVVLGGEVNSTATIDYDHVVREVFRDLKFTPEHGLEPTNIKIINLIGKQSPEITHLVEHTDGSVGAGDQGFMIGYASNDAPNYLPLGVYLAQIICRFVAEQPGMGPDVKSQVIVSDGKVDSILVSTQHEGTVESVRELVLQYIRTNKVGTDLGIFTRHELDKVQIDVNPRGEWHIGGPVADCGVTGRKIVVDQWGGYANVGGGCFSGKDGSKVDRSAAYMARYIAKNIVASGLTNECKVELSYTIGISEPTSVGIEVDVDSNVDTDALVRWIREKIDLTPSGIIQRFGLKRPMYYDLARNGHYRPGLPWEELDLEF